MPKIKTVKSAAKRFKSNGSGAIKRAQANKRHILTKKAQKRKRQLRDVVTVAKVDIASVKKMNPYV